MPRLPQRRAKAQGFTLIEMMVAIAIAMIVTAGLCVILMNMKGTFLAQDKMSQLQDSERLALTMLTNSVQAAGYFVDPVNNTVADSLAAVTITNADASTTTMADGQAITGTGNGTSNDTLSVRNQTALNDGLMNCQGISNTTATSPPNGVFVNSFALNAQGELTCAVNGGTPVALISKVAQMTVLYGVDTDQDGSVDQYMTAAAVTTGSYWTQVCTVQVSLTFQNPLSPSVGNTNLPAWVQTISLMNKV